MGTMCPCAATSLQLANRCWVAHGVKASDSMGRAQCSAAGRKTDQTPSGRRRRCAAVVQHGESHVRNRSEHLMYTLMGQARRSPLSRKHAVRFVVYMITMSFDVFRRELYT